MDRSIYWTACFATEPLLVYKSKTGSSDADAKLRAGLYFLYFCLFFRNIGHMVSRHSFHVPDVEFLSDMEGLTKYLWQKIHYGHTCLYCHRHFHSAEATKNHMMSKGHTMIGFDEGGEEEIAPFYDFSQDAFVALEKEEGEGEAEEDDGMYDSDFEDIEDESELVEDADQPRQVCTLVMRVERGLLFSFPLRRPAMISMDDSELILPSGKRIGHRDYRRYYKQYLKPSHVSGP